MAALALLLAGASTALPSTSGVRELGSTQTEKRLSSLLTESDRERIDDALAGGPGRHTVRWRNSSAGVDYTMVLAPTFNTARGACREFEIEARSDDRSRQAHGTACEKRGSWRIVE